MAIVGTQGTPVVSTVRDLINRAFRFIHVLGAGETLTVDEAEEAFDVLNGLIEQANVDKLLGYYKTEIVVPCTSDKAVYTIGPASTVPDVTAPRPVEIINGYSRRDGIDLPMFIGHKDDYDGIRQKSVKSGGWTQVAWYEPTWPKGTLTIYQVPADGRTELHLTAMAEIPVFTSLDDGVSLPPTYTFWMVYKLGERLSPEYGMEFTQKMQDILTSTEATLKRNNIKPFPVAGSGLSGLSSVGEKYNVYADNSRK